MDTASYRGALSHLKRARELKGMKERIKEMKKGKKVEDFKYRWRGRKSAKKLK